MPDRVTQNLLSSTVLNNLNRNVRELLELQSKVSSGKRITRPSDDPVGTSTAMRLRTRLDQTQQFLRNMKTGDTQLNTADGVFDDMSELLMRAQDLAIQQANVTADDRTRSAVAEEVNALINQFVDLLNTRVGNRYLFAGHETTEKPFIQHDNGLVYQGDSGDLNIEIDNGTLLGVNTPGSILMPSVTDDLGDHADLDAYSERQIPLGQRNLEDLNQGAGVDRGLFRVTDRSGVTAVIDMRDARTLQEAAFRISNAQDQQGRNLKIEAQIDETNGRLVLVDQTSVNDRIPGQRIDVQEVGNGRVARQLGIVGDDDDNDGVFEGRALAPIPLTTRLEQLNNGSGVEKGRFRITDRAGNTAVVDISEAETITDVRELINQAGLNVQAEINTGGSGILLFDSTTGTPQNQLTVSEFSTGTHTARDLGILTPEQGIKGGLLIGEGLNPVLTRDTPVSLLNRGRGFDLGPIDVKNGSLEGQVDLSRSATVGEVIDKINNAGLNLSAQINDIGTGISVTSTVGGRTLKITDGEGAFTATLLGIAGSRNVLVDPVDPLGASSELQPAVDGETRLRDLNAGDGVDPGAFSITDAEGNTVYLDISNVNSLQGVINKINRLGTPGDGVVNVTARISDDLKGITLIDNSIPNTVLQRATSQGELNIELSQLNAGDTVVLNTFDLEGVETASSLTRVSSPAAGETSITGTIDTIEPDAGRLSITGVDGQLYDVVTDQPIDNLFIGQQIHLNGQINPTGQFEARTVQLVDGPAANETQLAGALQSVDTINGTVTVELADGSTRTVDLILDRGLIKVEDTLNSTAAADLGIAGMANAGSDRIIGGALDPLISANTKLSLLEGGTFTPGRINIQNGDRDVVVDLSDARTVQDVIVRLNNSPAQVVASINDAGTGISIQSRLPGTSLVVNKIALKNPDGSNRKNPDGTTVFDPTADSLGLTGSQDIMGNLMFLRNALLNNNQEDIQRTLNNFPDSLNRVLNQRTKSGARVNQLDSTEERSQDSRLRNTEILSGVEDIDIIEAISELAAQENAFNAALSAAGRVIQPSLLDFL